MEVNLSEEAFNEPTDFDYLPLVYFRIAKPLKDDVKLTTIVDLTKVHVNKEGSSSNKAFNLGVYVSSIHYGSKKGILQALVDA